MEPMGCAEVIGALGAFAVNFPVGGVGATNGTAGAAEGVPENGGAGAVVADGEADAGAVGTATAGGCGLLVPLPVITIATSPPAKATINSVRRNLLSRLSMSLPTYRPCSSRSPSQSLSSFVSLIFWTVRSMS